MMLCYNPEHMVKHYAFREVLSLPFVKSLQYKKSGTKNPEVHVFLAEKQPLSVMASLPTSEDGRKIRYFLKKSCDLGI